MSGLIDLTGRTFGRLTVIERAGNADRSDGQIRPTWRCKCSCGNEVIVIGANLRYGSTRSCGCLRDELIRERAKRGVKNSGRKRDGL